MKHTSGPWSTENINGTDVVFDPHHFCICEVTYQENNANAMLIAAAPDLLKELESAHKFMSVYLDKHRGSLGQNWEGAMAAGIELMETAIKKARGL